jgi:hypothetical protein
MVAGAVANVASGAVIAEAVMLLAHHCATLWHCGLTLALLVVHRRGWLIDDAAMSRQSSRALLAFAVVASVCLATIEILVLNRLCEAKTEAFVRRTATARFELVFFAVLLPHDRKAAGCGKDELLHACFTYLGSWWRNLCCMSGQNSFKTFENASIPICMVYRSELSRKVRVPG